MKKLLVAALFAPLLALAQTYPSPVFNTLTLQSPLTVTNGGTGSSSSTGSGSVVLSTSASLTTPNLGTPSSVTLTNGTGLPISSGVSGLGSGAAAGLSSATNGPGGVPTVNGSIAAGNCIKWSTSGIQDAGSPCGYDANILNVVSTYGAVGNSNGTHGNGTDNTAAFQSAFNAGANRSIFIPCGTYRITAPITVTDANPRWISGNGACTKIYSDQTVAAATFSFSPASGTCNSSTPSVCVAIENLQFIAPNTLGGAQVAIALTNENAPYIYNVEFAGQQFGMTFALSFAPTIHSVRFYGGVVGIYSADQSFNSGSILSSGFYGMSNDAIAIVPSTGCATAVSINFNDLEQNGAAVALGGVCSGTFSQNYVEALSTQSILALSGTNSNLYIAGNNLNGGAMGGTGTMTISNVTTAQFVNNNFINLAVVYGSSASNVRLRKVDNNLTGSTFPATNVACTGLGTGGSCSIGGGDDLSGYVSMTTGSSGTAATGNITLTYSNGMGINNSTCSWTPVNVTGSWMAPVTVIGSSTTTTTSVGTWTNGAALMASKVYFVSYHCQGA